MTLAYASLVLIWASFALEIHNQRRAIPPLSRSTSLAFSLIAGMAVGVLLSVLGIRFGETGDVLRLRNAEVGSSSLLPSTTTLLDSTR